MLDYTQPEFRHACLSFPEFLHWYHPLMTWQYWVTRLQKLYTYPYIDVYLQGVIVLRKQLGMRTSCLVADGELKEERDIWSN